MVKFLSLLILSLGFSFQVKAESFRRSSDLQSNLVNQNLLGNGFKINLKSPVTGTCASPIERTSEGINFSYNIHRITKAQDFHTNDIELKKFLIKSEGQLKKFNFEKLKPFSILLSLNFENDGLGVGNDQIEIIDFYKNLLEKGKTHSFFEFCGSNYINSQKGMTNYYIFMTFYAQNEKLEHLILDGLNKALYNQDPSNSFRLNIFENLKSIGYVYLNTLTNAGETFLPKELGLSKLGNNGIKKLLDGVFNSMGNSTNFNSNFFQYQAWRNLPTFRQYCTSFDLNSWGRLGCFPGHKYTDLQLMAQALTSFNKKKSLVKFLIKNGENENTRQLKSCQRDLSKFKGLKWETFDTCLFNISINNIRSILKEKNCRLIRSHLNRVDSIQSCKILNSIKTKKRHFHTDLVNTPFLKNSSRRLTKRKVKLGSLFFHDGIALKKENCILQKTKKMTGEPLIKDTSYEYYPLKKTPNNRTPLIHFKAKYQISSTSEYLLPQFELTQNAKKNLGNLSKFYLSCGTHYLNQIQRKRGFYLNLQFKKNDLYLKSKGFNISQINKLLNPQYKGKLNKAVLPRNISISIHAYGVSKETRDHPFFKVKNLRDYIRRKTQIINLLEDSDFAITQAYSATPWSSYLLGNELIKRSQL